MKRIFAVIIALAIIGMPTIFQTEEVKAVEEITPDIVVENGTTEPRNVSFEIPGNIIVRNNSKLILTQLIGKVGMNIIVEENSTLVLDNSNIIMNSTNGEIKIDSTSSLEIYGEIPVNISSPYDYSFKIYGRAKISNAVIENTTRGVEIYSSFVEIRKSIIKNNALFGILIEGVNGFPEISDTTIENNNIGIISRNSNPRINNCTIKENSRGIHLENSTAIIENSRILNNNESGVYLLRSQPELRNNSIEKNPRGFLFPPEAYSNFTILNSKFEENGNAFEFKEKSNSHIILLNTTINSPKTVIFTPPPFVFDRSSSSSAIISWHLKVKVKNFPLMQVQEFPLIVVKDGKKNEVYNATTNDVGESSLIACKEKKITEDGEEEYNLYNISVKIGKIAVNKTVKIDRYTEQIIDLRSYYGKARGKINLEGRDNSTGVVVELKKNGTLYESKETNEFGDYEFDFLLPGTYTISASFPPDYLPQKKEINITAGNDTIWNAYLRKVQPPIIVEEKEEGLNILIIPAILLPILIITIIIYYIADKSEKRLKEKIKKKTKKK